ncbi:MULTISPECIES: LPS export ABC transporter periplasmic protein LptC [unclassified Sphingomonas]|uniref:LPS export ABC transporter periplasmic protein LptC n=1 Tax=unclassified Sphingomonas TaxID=196159 RepID=UPI0022698BAF|nr:MULTISPECIES: LPS export ABC transporter periplasmic protein LptC [unclassified Sphingomonas]
MAEVARPPRTARQRWAAPGSRHDRLIATLGFGLPAAIGVLTAFLVLAPLTSTGDVSFVLDKNKVEVAKERLKLQAATYRGQDDKGQPFAINVASGVQKSSAVPVVQINKMAADIQLDDGPAQLHADKGAYDLDTEKLQVIGPVAFRAADGYRIDTQDAVVDLKQKTMDSGGKGVTGVLPQGNFSANKLHANLEGRTVKLDGNARLRIVPRGAK